MRRDELAVDGVQQAIGGAVQDQRRRADLAQARARVVPGNRLQLGHEHRQRRAIQRGDLGVERVVGGILGVLRSDHHVVARTQRALASPDRTASASSPMTAGSVTVASGPPGNVQPSVRLRTRSGEDSQVALQVGEEWLAPVQAVAAESLDEQQRLALPATLVVQVGLGDRDVRHSGNATAAAPAARRCAAPRPDRRRRRAHRAGAPVVTGRTRSAARARLRLRWRDRW